MHKFSLAPKWPLALPIEPYTQSREAGTVSPGGQSIGCRWGHACRPEEVGRRGCPHLFRLQSVVISALVTAS